MELGATLRPQPLHGFQILVTHRPPHAERDVDRGELAAEVAGPDRDNQPTQQSVVSREWLVCDTGEPKSCNRSAADGLKNNKPGAGFPGFAFR